jgi:predicted ABC-type ATPase
MVPGVREQQKPFLNERRSFAVEDIGMDTQLLDEARAAGYTTKVLFISTEDANLNVGRILVRMSRGGKVEAVSSIINSYKDSTKNLAEVRKHADELIVYDNTAHDRGYRVVAHFIGGERKQGSGGCTTESGTAPAGRSQLSPKTGMKRIRS